MNKRYYVKFEKDAEKEFRRRKPKSMWAVTCGKFCRELEYYIRCHEKAGKNYDPDSQDILYDERMVVTIRKEQGVWFITDVQVYNSVISYSPIYAWKLVKIGYSILPVKFLAAWRIIRSPNQK